ncbi:MAG: hypothetical protein GX456_05645 [Verrucomicrobia bacterium]|nr:hypothetical protein [Verrucomicrobiota bacterium]
MRQRGETTGISVLLLATESLGIFPCPTWLKVHGVQEPGTARGATLVPATPGYEICG